MGKTRHPLLYLGIILAWSWAFCWPTALTSAGIGSFNAPMIFGVIGSFGILPLALLFAALEGGRSPMGRMLKGTFIVPRGRSVWGLALMPALLILVGIVLGGLILSRDSFFFAPKPMFMLVGIIISAWVEEVVWRGFITPRLLDRFTPARASLWLGLVWMLWHLPYYWEEGFSAWGPLGWFGWAPFYLAYTYVLTWLYMRSGGSVLVTTVSHTAVNWAISWMDPFWLENAGSLFAAVVLVPILWRRFPRR